MGLLGKKGAKLAPVKDFSAIPPSSAEKSQGRRKKGANSKGEGKYDFTDTELDPQEPYCPRGAAHKTWHLNLRCIDAHKPANGWRRHFTRPFQTFDHLNANLADASFREEYQKLEGTPRRGKEWHPDRQKGHWGGILQRDDDANFVRSAGCEGAQAGQWLHLLTARHERCQLAHETTLRDSFGDQSGARVTDNRSEGCIVEMLGKKKWCNASPRTADLHLRHLDYLRVSPEVDDANLRSVRSKTPRRDAALCSTPSSPQGTPTPGVSSPTPPAR